MIHARMSRKRLALAIATGLAVTAGPLAVPAAALPSAPAALAPAAPASEDGVASIAPGHEVVGAGPSGFLTRENADYPHLAKTAWTRYSDGVTVPLSAGHQGTESDVAAYVFGTKVKLKDMTAGGDPVEIELRHAGPTHRYAGVIGSTVIAVSGAEGSQKAHLVSRSGGALVDREITGLPQAERIQRLAASDGAVLFQYVTRVDGKDRWSLAVVDVATAAVTDTHRLGAPLASAASAVSATHAAWIESADSGNGTLVVAGRGGGEPKRSPLKGVSHTRIGLAGKWVVHGNSTRLEHGSSEHPMALTATPVNGGASQKLLDHFTSLVPGPGDSLLAMGGSVGTGEGVYRIAPGKDGAPTATKVAGTGQPTEVVFTGNNLPKTVDLDRNNGELPMEWKLSRLNVRMVFTLRNERTGTTTTRHLSPDNGDSKGPGRANLTWDGLLDAGQGRSVAASNGAYTWSATATPINGIGAPATAKGSFTAVRKTAPHDFSDNGSPDLLALDASGKLWRHDTHYDRLNKTFEESPRKAVAGSWSAYDRIEAAGNLGGSTTGDLVARDKDGVLWLFEGRTDGTFAGRKKAATGLKGYQHLAGGFDLTGDGKADLAGLDSSGVLYVHPGTGTSSAPFTARKKTGTGLKGYVELVSAGNLGGSSANDLVTRDKDGVLWLHQGKGDGTFSARVKIGGGWKAYSHLVGVGDGDRDGKADLYGFGPNGTSDFYAGTGTAKTPFKARNPSVVLTEKPYGYKNVL